MKKRYIVTITRTAQQRVIADSAVEAVGIAQESPFYDANGNGIYTDRYECDVSVHQEGVDLYDPRHH